MYYRNDIEELRAALFEIGSIQKREESCETDVPIVPCCDVINGATRKPSLLEAQEIGEKKLQVMVFPLFSTHGREVWSYVIFLFTLGLATRSAVSLALNFVKENVVDRKENSTVVEREQNSTVGDRVDYVDLGLSSVACVLAFLDLVVIIYFHRCRLAHDACKKCRGAEDDAEMQPLIPQQGTATADEEDDSFCSYMLRRYADVLRMALYDILVYLITICSMFRMIWSILHDKGNFIRSISIFAGQTLVSVITIYGIRIFVIARIIFLIQKARKNGPMINSGRWSHFHFFLHIIGQMVSQVVMVIFIGVKFYFENFQPASTVKVSFYLWYMIISGPFISFFGVLTYKIGNYYSVTEYPIKFFFDLLLTSERNVGNKQSLRFKSIHLGMSSEEEQYAKSIAQKALRNFIIYRTNCLCKYFYVFVKPVLYILSIPYTILLFAFIICFVVRTMGFLSCSIGWVTFIVIGITLICLANIRVLLVGGVWFILLSMIMICRHGRPLK